MSIKNSYLNNTNVLNEYGKLVWKHKTNKRLFLEKSYEWVDSIILLDETDGRQIVDQFKASTFDFSAWEPMTKNEFDSVKSKYKEINKKLKNKESFSKKINNGKNIINDINELPL